MDKPMRVRMFMAQFAPLVKRKINPKRQTIRPTPKGRRPQVGDVESWRAWSGKAYRSKQVELAQVRIVSVDNIFISRCQNRIILNAVQLTPEQADALAKLDGFKDFSEMEEWFENHHGLPFKGILIRGETV